MKRKYYTPASRTQEWGNCYLMAGFGVSGGTVAEGDAPGRMTAPVDTRSSF